MLPKKYFLWGILLLALILRLYHLDDKAPGTDEHWSIIYAEDTLSGKYYESLEKYTLPPGFNYPIALMIVLTDNALYAIRLLMVAFGLLSIFLLYLLTKYLFTEKAALLTAFFISINSFHIMYSQHIRSYIFLMVLFLLATILFYRYIITKKTKLLYPLTLIYILSFYTHIFTAFYVAAHFVIALIYSLKKHSFKLKPYAIAIGVTALMSAFWLPVIYKQATVFVPAAVTLDLIGLHNFYIAFHVFYKFALTVDVSTTFQQFPFLFGMAVINSLIFLYGCYSLYKKHFTKSIFLIITLFLPIALLLGVATIFPLYSFRYSVYLFPLYMLILVQGLLAVPNKYLRRSLIFLVLVTSLYVLSYYYTIVVQPKWNIPIAI